MGGTWQGGWWSADGWARGVNSQTPGRRSVVKATYQYGKLGWKDSNGNMGMGIAKALDWSKKTPIWPTHTNHLQNENSTSLYALTTTF